MRLQLYRCHRPECEAGRPWQSRSSEFDERRKDWGRKCACQIHASGTLGGKFSRRALGTSDWSTAHRLAEKYIDAESWTGTAPPAAVPETTPAAPPRITIDEA